MNQNHKTRRAFAPLTIAFTAVLLLSPLAASAAATKPAEKPAPAIELGAPLGENMILQLEMEVPIWGWSKPRTTITVEIAGQTESAKAGADGKWTNAVNYTVPRNANIPPPAAKVDK